MINFVTTKDHQYTLRKMLDGKLGRLTFKWRLWSYESLFRKFRVNTGTWIFQDIERLSEVELLKACRIASRLEDAGADVINHPVKVASRYELQRKLFNAGLNKFEVFRADEHRIPGKWPVFIRFENNHKSPNPKLIYSIDDLDQSLASYQASNIPLKSLLVVEYYGAPNIDGLWRKFSAFRVGDDIVHHHIVTQDSWVAKYGNPKLEFDDESMRRIRLAEKDFIMVTGDPFNLLNAFKLGGIEFGRADFNFINGEAQIYEINTNPTLGTADSVQEKFAEIPRAPIIQYANNRIVQSLGKLDSRNITKVSISDINYFRSLPWRPVKRP